MQHIIPTDRINWVTSTFLISTALLAITGVPVYLCYFGLDAFLFKCFLLYFIATGLSITLGYHRLFSHLAFKARWPVKLFVVLFGAAAFENSILDWASDHRDHHKHVDEDDDPYNINKGFFHAHIGWLLFKLRPEHPRTNVADLRKDKFVMWQHQYCHWIGFLVGFVVPTIIGYLHNGAVGALGGFLIPGIARLVFVQHMTFFINSLCHCVGKRPYSSKCSARDSSLMAFFTFGEGYHNYHHEFQHDYRNGVKPWQFDPTKWTIWLLSKLGLASQLRRVPAEKILLAEVNELRFRASQAVEKSASSLQPAEDMLKNALAAVGEAYSKLGEYSEQLQALLAERVECSRNKIKTWQTELSKLANQLEANLKILKQAGFFKLSPELAPKT